MTATLTHAKAPAQPTPVRAPPVPPGRIEIGRTDDPAEHEADRVAALLLRMPDPHMTLRRCACGGSDGPDGECTKCEARRIELQRSPASPAAGSAPPAQVPVRLAGLSISEGLVPVEQLRPSAVHRALDDRSPGRALDFGAEFSGELQNDFRQVRVHADDAAARLAAGVKADAFTRGNNIYFGRDKYDPGTAAGRLLVYHELAHVLQQGRGEVSAYAGRVVPHDHHTEHRASSSAPPRLTTVASAGAGTTIQRRPTATDDEVDVRRPSTERGSTQPSRSLRDLVGKKPSADTLRATREYAAYMDPDLVWQWGLRARPDEALLACREILGALENGEQVDWFKRARDFLLNARELLHPKITLVIPPPKLAAKHRYRIELKAWIPHAQVVDPVPGITDSHYRGDNHVGYDGSWRVLNWVEFDWDGKEISNFHGGDSYGTSHRDWERWPFHGTETATQTGYTGRELNTPAYFTMWISSKNPIPLAPAPEINSTLDVIATCDSLSLVYTTDEFPSHGIRVFQDGQIVETRIAFDASAVDGSDPWAILLGLTEFENKGDLDVAVPPDLEKCQAPDQLPATMPP